MICPECNSKTKVTDTAVNSSKGSESSSNDRANMVSRARRAYDWAPDFVVRRRKCKKCEWKSLTIEVILSDLAESYEKE